MLKNDPSWEGHVYSFTQLESFEQCPVQYYNKYVLKLEGEDNVFAQYGLLAHSIIERWSKGELPIEDMASTWEIEYSEKVTKEYPKYLSRKGFKDKKYLGAFDYFSTFDGFVGYEVVCTEERMTTDINGKKFVGVMDLLLRDSVTGELVLVDHKSKGKNYFKSKQDSKHLYRQTYLYCKFIKEKFGEFPARIRFNLFSESDYDEREFNINEYNEAIKWASNIIDAIENNKDWEQCGVNKPYKMANTGRLSMDFFCDNICDVKDNCDTYKAALNYVK